MQRLYAILVGSIIIIMASSCQSDKDAGALIEFDIPEAINNPEEIKMSDFISQISYIALETTQESLIGRVHTLVPAEDKFLISSRSKTVHVFSDNGEYIKDIGKIGKGPGEYVDARSVFWDDNLQEVIIYNIGNANLQFYTIDGEIKRTFKAPHSPMFVYRQQNGNFLGSLLFEAQFDSIFGRHFQFDTLGIVVPYGQQKDAEEQNIPLTFAMPSFFQMGDLDFFIPERSDTIFQIGDTELIPFAVLGLSDKMMPDKVYFNRDASSEVKSKYIYSINAIGLSEHEFVAEFKIGSNRFIAFCDIKNGSSKIVELDELGIPNDIDGGLPITNFFYSTISNGYMYMALSPIYFKSGLEEGILKNPSPEFIEMVSNFDEEANPVIIKMKLK